MWIKLIENSLLEKAYKMFNVNFYLYMEVFIEKKWRSKETDQKNKQTKKKKTKETDHVNRGWSTTELQLNKNKNKQTKKSLGLQGK